MFMFSITGKTPIFPGTLSLIFFGIAAYTTYFYRRKNYTLFYYVLNIYIIVSFNIINGNILNNITYKTNKNIICTWFNIVYY